MKLKNCEFDKDRSPRSAECYDVVAKFEWPHLFEATSGVYDFFITTYTPALDECHVWKLTQVCLNSVSRKVSVHYQLRTHGIDLEIIEGRRS